MTELGAVVVGVDGSDNSKRALAWAADEARLRHSPLEAVITWEYPTNFGWTPPWPEGFDFEYEATKVLAETVAAVLGDDPDIDVKCTTVNGNAAHVLRERSHEASMIVVGSRGHGGFAGLLLGSVSEFLAAHSLCPVTIVHEDEE
jgi:nucleotide-binding universal stress UspA family protein